MLFLVLPNPVLSFPDASHLGHLTPLMHSIFQQWSSLALHQLLAIPLAPTAIIMWLQSFWPTYFLFLTEYLHFSHKHPRLNTCKLIHILPTSGPLLQFPLFPYLARIVQLSVSPPSPWPSNSWVLTKCSSFADVFLAPVLSSPDSHSFSPSQSLAWTRYQSCFSTPGFSSHLHSPTLCHHTWESGKMPHPCLTSLQAFPSGRWHILNNWRTWFFLIRQISFLSYVPMTLFTHLS